MFSDLLRKKREAAGLTKAELAAHSGLSLAIIDDLELGAAQYATFDNCYKISQVLHRQTGKAFIFQDLWCSARARRSGIRLGAQARSASPVER